MTDEELALWVAENLDRKLTLMALEGSAFITRWRSAKTIKQAQPNIDPNKLSPALSTLHKAELIRSTTKYDKGRSRVVYVKGESKSFPTSFRVWRLTVKGANILRLVMLNDKQEA